MKHFVWILISLALVGCAHSSKQSSSSDEVSLKADRSEFDDLRKNMPPEVRKENDELAGVLQLLRSPEGNYQAPEKIREKFDSIMRAKRERQDKQYRVEREDFNRLQKDQREEFTENQKKERDSFYKDKPSSEARSRFSDKQEEKRSRFYDEAREKRRTFEDQISTRRRDFEDYLREKTNLFNQEYRNYQKEYDEHRKGEDLKKRMQQKGASTNSTKAPVAQPNNSGSTDNDVPNDLEQYNDEFKQIPMDTKKLESGE